MEAWHHQGGVRQVWTHLSGARVIYDPFGKATNKGFAGAMLKEKHYVARDKEGNLILTKNGNIRRFNTLESAMKEALC